MVMDPDPIRRVELAIEDIRAGRMVILVDDEDRENEGDLVLAADAVTPDAVNFMATHGRGLICLSLTEEQIDRLGLPMMAANNQSPYHTAFTVSIEARQGVTTGISAADRAQTIRVAADPRSGAQDIVTPGHIFPLKARKGGVLVRTGQTEGSVDLARMAGLTPAGVICEVMKDDGTMARLGDLKEFGEQHQMRIVAVADLIRYRLQNEVLVERVTDFPFSIPGVADFQARVYRSVTDRSLHLAVMLGDLDESPCLVRVQKSCPLGDVFRSPLSDSGLNLDDSLQKVAEEGRGCVLYLYLGGGQDPESVLGRIEQLLGRESADPSPLSGGSVRDLGTGSQILRDLGLSNLRLITNNTSKIVGLDGYGLEVSERIPMAPPRTRLEVVQS